MNKKTVVGLVFIICILSGLSVFAVDESELEICKNYEIMVKYETENLVAKIDQSKLDFEKSVGNLANSMVVRIEDVVVSSGKNIVFYMFIGILSIVTLSNGIINYFLVKKYRNIMSAYTDYIKHEMKKK